MKLASDTAAIALRFEYMSIWTALILSRVGCSFQSKLISFSKLFCLVFVVKLSLFLPSRTVYSFLFHLDVRESFRRRYKISFAHASHQLIQARIMFSVNCTTEVFAFASTHLLYPNECKLLYSTVIT